MTHPNSEASFLTLIGYRATGKTTLARLIAPRLGWDWADADVEMRVATFPTLFGERAVVRLSAAV